MAKRAISLYHHVRDDFQNQDACAAGYEWFHKNQHLTLKQIWLKCHRADWMIWVLFRMGVPLRQAVLRAYNDYAREMHQPTYKSFQRLYDEQGDLDHGAEASILSAAAGGGGLREDILLDCWDTNTFKNLKVFARHLRRHLSAQRFEDVVTEYGLREYGKNTGSFGCSHEGIF